MVWNPRKGAFRAGTVSGIQWDDANVGSSSTAFGNGSTASGSTSTAFGNSTLASGLVSTSFGINTSASGSYSTAFGFSTIASANTSTAFGNNTSANTINATSFGDNTNANGADSTAFGSFNTAASYGETVLGIGATTYTTSTNGATQFGAANGTDRLLVVGNAVDANNNIIVEAGERSDALVILKNGNTGFGVSAPVTRLQLASDSNATKTQITQALPSSGLLITTDFVANSYTPGLFWNTTNNNVLKPKAGIYLQETNVGTNMYLGTSNNYSTGITNDAVVINQDGNVGLGFNNPQTALDIVGAITVRPFVSAALTVDNQVVPVGTNGNIWLQSNSFVVGARTITLGDGVVLGQYLTLYNPGNTGDFEVADNTLNNTNTPASRTLGTGDIITLMWTGTFWSEVSFANN